VASLRFFGCVEVQVVLVEILVLEVEAEVPVVAAPETVPPKVEGLVSLMHSSWKSVGKRLCLENFLKRKEE
jgi:hypothetical protein